jgi:tetratricopeptide (TPR) repeat protein
MRSSFNQKLARQLSAIALMLCFLLSGLPPVLAQDVPVPPDTYYTLRDSLKSGKVKLKVQGDGVNTTKVSLQLSNTSDKPIKVVIPQNEVLHPNIPSIQSMIITEDIVVTINSGDTALVDIKTFCASPKSIPPPPEVTEGLNFDVGDYKDPVLWSQFAKVIAAGKELDIAGAYDASRPLNDALLTSFTDENKAEEIKRRKAEYLTQNPTKSDAEADEAVKKDMDAIEKTARIKATVKERQRRTNEITQLAIWKILGLQSGKPEDSVTPDSVGKDLIKGVSQAIQRDKTLAGTIAGTIDKHGNVIPDKKTQMAIDQRATAMVDLVDLTISRGSAKGLTGVAELPKDDPCSTFCSVGEREFNQGDLAEANHLLYAAVHLAESFGEGDPRLSRSLNGLGRVDLNLTWYGDAQKNLERALTLSEKVFGADSKQVADVKSNLGLLNLLTGKYAPASQLFDSAISIYEKAQGKTSNEVVASLNSKGKTLCLDSKPEEGGKSLDLAMTYALLNCPQDVKGNMLKTPFIAEIETNVADGVSQTGKYKDAANLYLAAQNIDKKMIGENHPFMAHILDGLAVVTEKQGQIADSQNYKKQADAIRDLTLDTGSKDIGDVAALPFGTEDLGRLWHYMQNKKESFATVRAGAPQPLVADATRMSRPIKDKWALVIGISKFKDPTISLQYAAKDAADFADYLVKEGHFAPDHVRLLVNEKATRAEILGQLGSNWLPRVANPDDLVMIFFSSHGSPTSMDVGSINYLVAYDTDKTNLYGTGIGLQDFTDQIKKRVNSERVVLVMDACHSGAAIADGAKGLFRDLGVDATPLAQGTGQLVICSSGANQSSWESTRYKNGVFTHYLLEGLRLDNNMNKLGKAFEYMKDKVQQEVQMDRHGARQTPALQSKWVGNELVVGIPPADPRPGIKDGDPNASQVVVGSKGVIRAPLPSATKGTTVQGSGKASASGIHKPVTATAQATKSPGQAAKAKPQVH